MEKLIFPVTKDKSKRRGVSYSADANKNAVFPSLIRNLRKEKGLSQEKLAKELGISKSTLGLYETGDTLPDIETSSKIAEYFNVSLDYLAGKSRCKLPDDEEIRKHLALTAEALNGLKNLQQFRTSGYKEFRVINFLLARPFDPLISDLYNYLFLKLYWIDQSQLAEMGLFAPLDKIFDEDICLYENVFMVGVSDDGSEGRIKLSSEELNAMYLSKIQQDLLRIKNEILEQRSKEK